MGVHELEVWQIMFIILVIAIIFGIVCKNIAKDKGYSEIGFFFLGFFFPIIGLIIALCLNDKNAQNEIYMKQTAPQQLLEYKKLLDMGVITPQEFEAKKRELMR